MAYIADLMAVDLLEEMIAEGYVTRRSHPSDPSLTILNYGAKAQYDNLWNEATTQCRGLVLRGDEVLARPFPKFFNLGQHKPEEIPQEGFEVFDKLDGSLGILYPLNDRWAVATRGSFSSEQSQHATKILQRYLDDGFKPNAMVTYLFEIIYPSNRIVVNYGDFDDIVLLDVINTDTGESLYPLTTAGWYGTNVKSYPGFKALDDLLAAEQPENAEGYVIRFESGMRVKVKHDEYVRLHRIVTGVSARTIWELGPRPAEDLDRLLDCVPDEFYDWVRQTADQFQMAYLEALSDARYDYARATAHANWQEAPGTRDYRKVFAEVARTSEYSDVVFAMLDEKPYEAAIWKRLRPEATKPFYQMSEDTA